MAKKNNYWRRRAINFEEEWHNRCQQTVEKELAAHYQKALGAIQEDILKLYGTFAKDNGLDFDEARKILQGREFKQWRMSLQEYLQKISEGDRGLERELNTLAMRPRITRLEKLYSETLQELDKLGREVDKSLKDFLSEAYKENYHRNIFDLIKVGGLSVAISKLDNLSVEKVLASRWSGKNFSQRVWTNTKLLGKVLKKTIASGIHQGLSVPQMSRLIDDKMKSGYRNSVRLVRTEMNFVNNQAHFDSMQDAGVKAYEFIATLDNRTSAPCRTRDGETYLLEEKSVGFNYPPLHPRCRSTVCPFIEGVGKSGTRIAKVGGKYIDIPESMKYADFEKVYIKKEISLADWQKNYLNISHSKAKINSKNNLISFGEMNGKMSENETTEFLRRKKAPDGHEIIDKPTFNKLTAKFISSGGIIIRGEDAENHLKSMGAYASYIAGANAAFITDDAKVSDVLEEMYHAYQDRAKMFGDVLDELTVLKREIDAQKYLLSVSEKYKIPADEIEVTKENLRRYEIRLAEFLEESENYGEK